MLLVFHVVAFVALSIWPHQCSIPMHLVIFPHADVFTTIAPPIRPLALDIVLDKVSLVAITIGPCEDTMALFHTLDVVSFEL